MGCIRTGAIMLAFLAGVPAFAEKITAVLKLREKVSMEQLARNVQDPKSDHYQRFYTPEEIRDLSAPTDAEYGAFVEGLKQQGYEVISESTTHLWLTVKAERAQLTAMRPLRVTMIQSISGLDKPHKFHPKLVHGDFRAQAMGGVDPGTIKSSYGFNSIYAAGIDGTGQHIAIATYDGFALTNVQQYFKLIGLTKMPMVDLVQFNGSATYNGDSAGETELDAEFSGMIAPGAQIHVFASSTNDDPGELQMFTAILDDNRAKIVNYSWGECETIVTSAHKEEMAPVFARAVAQGVNIMVASGDNGSDACGDGGKVADWPSANPNVIAVGGTSFYQAKGVLAETGWNGSGGGISGLWDLPAYQSMLGAPYVKRSYPDVAFNADPYTGQAMYTGPADKPYWEVVGGTSMAAPQWSGFMALVGQARMMMKKGDLGFLNPYIYGLAAADRAPLFHDVVSGSNGAYASVPGWDAVTGFGSMQADLLLNKLQSF